MDKIVESGIPLHKCIAMGMAEGKTGEGYENMPAAPKGAMPMAKEDMGMRERKPGMAGMSDKY
ncbi:MAG: hypothetical protein Q7S17_02110 [Xanthobacteraceae bacterium]|nr:hypothetical protein [Xanthobacteraceae bacterium]